MAVIYIRELSVNLVLQMTDCVLIDCLNEKFIRLYTLLQIVHFRRTTLLLDVGTEQVTEEVIKSNSIIYPRTKTK